MFVYSNDISEQFRHQYFQTAFYRNPQKETHFQGNALCNTDFFIHSGTNRESDVSATKRSEYNTGKMFSKLMLG